MKRFSAGLALLVILGAVLAQPPRREEEDPKAKPGKAIDIESFPPAKADPPAPKASPAVAEGPGVKPAAAVLVVGVRQLPQGLTPRAARSEADLWALDLLYESLMRPVVSGDGVFYEPMLAADVRAEPAGRTFLLDPAAQWSDGTPVLANDVIASLERNRPAALGDATTDAPRRVTLLLRLPVPEPAALFTFKIQPAARPDEPVGSGPFAFAGLVTQGERTYARFPTHPHAGKRGRPPALKEVRFLLGSDPLADLRRGIADVVIEERTGVVFGSGSNPNRIETTLGADVRIVTRPTRRVHYLAVNPLKNAFAGDAGRPVRRAVAFAVRRDAILDELWRAKEPPTHRALTGPFPSGAWPADPEAPTLDDEPLARAELRTAARPAEPLRLIHPAADATGSAACQKIAAQLAAAGLPCAAQPLSDDEFRRALAEKQYDLAYRHFDFADDWFDPTALFAEAGSTPRLDAELGRAAARGEFAARRDAYRRLHRDFRAEMPFIPLWNLDAHVLLRRGIDPYPAADRLDPHRLLADADRWRVTR